MIEADRIPVLMYHRVGTPDSPSDVYCVSPARFDAHMAALANAGYHAISIDSFERWLSGVGSLPEKAFLLTFDDGFLGVYEHAAPVLVPRCWPATAFLVVGKVGRASDWMVTTRNAMKVHPLMGAIELQQVRQQGFSLQSHSYLHQDLTTLQPEMLRDDLERSRDAISELTGEIPRFIAYPYGRHNEWVREAAKRAGFSLGFSVESGFNRVGQAPFSIRRIDVFGTDTPRMLMRKVRLGTNDGSLDSLFRYYGRRLIRRG